MLTSRNFYGNTVRIHTGESDEKRTLRKMCQTNEISKGSGTRVDFLEVWQNEMCAGCKTALIPAVRDHKVQGKLYCRT